MDVLLHLSLLILPLEAFDQVSGVDWPGKSHIELGKEPLELVEDAVGGLGMEAIVILPEIDGLLEIGGHVERLKEAVHVAGGPDVGKSFII